ncbi:hypothetical protein L1987_32897 [Smallanthus sonchifolius]|uniref:Uncharacterized protein n=1 Tax=Smallanthus sonchifolius TaxID=185202 RepID=A0ACB9HS45_9ASTR|nr:hypothetical protein L1987_32897 [Smallanthus sonchifolius]
MGISSFVDDIRRWFQRHNHPSNPNAAVLNPDYEPKPSSSSSSITQITVVEDFDRSAFKKIRVPKRIDSDSAPMDPLKRLEREFFTEYGEASRYQVQEVVGKGKIKLLRLLRHPDIVEIRHIMLPPSRREFRDIYVVFELMESDLHQVIRANDDLTPEHYQFFLYQLLRGLKYIHSANIFHRDLKPKNILANADCKLKICDFGLARVSFNDAPSAIFWTYTPAIDIWSIGCIFAEMLTGKPLFPGKNVVHQLDLMTDLLGTPPPETIARIRNEKARRYLNSMRKKQPVPFTHKFPNVDPLALKLLERLIAFDPKDRPSAEESLADPYFNGLSNGDREPSTQPISKLEFEFERRKLGKDDVRELIYREFVLSTVTRSWSIILRCFRNIYAVVNKLASCTREKNTNADVLCYAGRPGSEFLHRKRKEGKEHDKEESDADQEDEK